jgi:hypothetical protein
MKKIILLFCLLSCAFSASPSTPQVPDTFYSKVSVSQSEGNNYWRGGGIHALDVPNGRERIDLSLEGPNGNKAYHILDRYDLNETFNIGEFNCTEASPNGKLVNPFAWVSMATFSGTSTYEGKQLDDWTYTSGSTTQRLFVLQSNANVPVFYSQKVTYGNGEIALNEITFLEFNTVIPGDWVFTVPQMCNAGVQLLGGDASSVVYYANTHWDCADVSCSSRVPAGSGQPSYECAEFVSRSLAYGGYFSGLSASAPQSTFLNWKGYDLCLTTSLIKALPALAGYKQKGSSGSDVVAAGVIFGNAGDGSMSHTCVGIATGMVDCHNNAREDVSAAGEMYLGINAVYGP